MGDFEFDATSLEELTADLFESVARFTVETDRTLVEVGGIVKEAAKKVAEAEGSSSIPPTIKSHPAPGMVVVTAGTKDVQLAALWELGNQGKSRKLSTFDHPVFPTGPRETWTWTSQAKGDSQKKHPFLKRARTLSRRAINGLMNETYERVLEPLGRRGGND